ncbi:MCM10-like protein [Nymphaea thermarum]|nr:MCM10-like protein [Nymphaea thermarum]
MSAHEEDLDLLLSLQDRVSETPPTSPRTTLNLHDEGYLSDDGMRKRPQKIDMSAFKDAVKDCLHEESETAPKVAGSKVTNRTAGFDIEKFSGLRIGNMTLPTKVLNDRFSEVRFIRLPTIGNVLAADDISGHWATIGVLAEKGSPRQSSSGKNFCIWKLGCLNGTTVSLFLFGDAYAKNWKETVGSVFGLFNAGIRKETKGKEFSLSLFSASQIVKLGTSLDYGVCKGDRKDGTSCSMVINKRLGIYCKYHCSKQSKKYSTVRAELKGGNIGRPFGQRLNSEGIYMVSPSKKRTMSNPARPAKVLDIVGLRKALTNAAEVTTRQNSQGIRFLSELTAKNDRKDATGGQELTSQQKGSPKKRLSSAMGMAASMVITKQREAKRTKCNNDSEDVIELEIVD